MFTESNENLSILESSGARSPAEEAGIFNQITYHFSSAGITNCSLNRNYHTNIASAIAIAKTYRFDVSIHYLTRWKPTLSATLCIAKLSEAALQVARLPAFRIAAVTNETTACAYPRLRASGRVDTLATSHAASE